LKKNINFNKNNFKKNINKKILILIHKTVLNVLDYLYIEYIVYLKIMNWFPIFSNIIITKKY